MNKQSVKEYRLKSIALNLEKIFNEVLEENAKTKKFIKIKKMPQAILSVFNKIENGYSPDGDTGRKWNGWIKPEEYYSKNLLLIKKNITSECIRLKRIVKNKTFTEKNWKSINAILVEMNEQIADFNKEINKNLSHSKTK